MILVLGGTTEAKELALALAGVGQATLVSTAYAFAAEFIPDNPLVDHISGKLDAGGLQTVIEERGVAAVVDATHPYAIRVSETAEGACMKAGVPYFRFEREDATEVLSDEMHIVDTPQEAMRLACELGETIFIAAGSNAAGEYRLEAARMGRKAYIRVLPQEDSVAKCRAAGFAGDEIVTGIGPFSYEDNHALWQRLGIDVLITKESGRSGGFGDKVLAAHDLGIAVVVIRRPDRKARGDVLVSVSEAVEALRPYFQTPTGA